MVFPSYLLFETVGIFSFYSTGNQKWCLGLLLNYAYHGGKKTNLYNKKMRQSSSSTEAHYFVCIHIETFLKSKETTAQQWRFLWFRSFAYLSLCVKDILDICGITNGNVFIIRMLHWYGAFDKEQKSATAVHSLQQHNGGGSSLLCDEM